jgi:tetratricopeptide (TPR) repeat protein
MPPLWMTRLESAYYGKWLDVCTRMGGGVRQSVRACKWWRAARRCWGRRHTLASMGNLASTYRLKGQYDDAEELGKQVMETRKKKLGADHPDTLASMANLASTYRNQGRWDAAEELGVQVMELCKAKLGADHPDTLISMANLAFIWKEQSRYIEAISLMRECVQLRNRKLAASHPDSISSSRTLTSWEKEQWQVRSLVHGGMAEARAND